VLIAVSPQKDFQRVEKLQADGAFAKPVVNVAA